MTSKENYVTINSNKIVSKLNDVFIGEDSKDILNINSKLLVRGVENTLLPKPNNNDKGKLVKLNNTGDDYDLVELKENNTRVHKICNMVPGEDTDTSAQLDFWTGIKPVDGDLILKKNEEVIYFINISGFQNLQNDTLLTWKLSYKIKGDTNYTDFTDSNRDSDGTFSHNFDSINDHQHRAFQIYYKVDNDIIIDAFKVSFLTIGACGNIYDFLSINALILSDGNAISKYITEYSLAGAGGTAAFTAYASGTESVNTVYNDSLTDRYTFTNPRNNVFFAYNFDKPQVVNKYRIWGYISGNIAPWPANWELRASKIDRASYDAEDSSTYNVLDAKTITSVPTFTNSGTASNNISGAVTCTFTNSIAYTYYVLHIISNGGDVTNTHIYQFALYTSYTLPSQIGNSGRQLITDGVNLGWGGPISNLNTTITADDKYKLVKLNEEGTLEYCSTDAIQLPSGNNLQRPLGIDGMIRYNNESDNMEVVENGSWKIVNTNNFNEATMGLINRAITDTSYDDEYNNSFGYYYHNRTLCPLYSEKLVYNVWHQLNFDKVFYDHSPNTNMINLLYNKIYIRETGEYLLTYSSAFKSTGGTDLNTKFKYRIYKNENSLVNSGDIHYESDEFQAIQTQIITNYGKFPLAGAGGTTSFTVHNTAYNTSYGSPSDLHDNSLAPNGSGANTFFHYYSSNPGKATVGYEFTELQKVSGFAIYPRNDAATYKDQNPKDFDLKAAKSITDYNNGVGVVTLLSVTNATWNQSWNTTLKASNNTNLSNYYAIPANKQGNYGYYELVINTTETGGGQNRYASMSEFVLYGNEINNHYFIPEFNHVLNLQQNDCISLYLYHTNNGSNSILLSYDYLGGKLRGLNYSRSNLYNYEYIKTIASKLCIKKILNN